MYGLCGFALAGVIGGTVAWASVDDTKTVNLKVDAGIEEDPHHGQDRGFRPPRRRDIRVGPRRVAPAATAKLHNGGEVVLKRGDCCT